VIIKGKAVGSVRHWSRYLPEAGENEKIVEHEIRGTVSHDLKGALEEMRDLASVTRSQGNFLYHASLNPRADEKLSPEQWMRAIDLVEECMELSGHQRIVYEHVKEGRQHFHVLWNRVDPNTLTIQDIKGDRYTLRRAANELEREFGLTPTKAVRYYDDARPYEEWEKDRAARSKIDVKAMKAELTELWLATDCGKAFIAAIEERGYAIAKGDRRDFVVLDPAGDVHSLARRLEGVRVAEVRARFADVDRDGLPDVEQARLAQRARFLDHAGVFDRDAAEQAWEARLAANAIAHDRAAEAGGKSQERHALDREIQQDWLGQSADITQAQDASDAQSLGRGLALEDAWEPGEPPAPHGGQFRSEHGIRVANGITGVALGLLDFVTAFLDPAPARPQNKNLARNEPVRDHDIRALTQMDIHKLRDQGEPYLRQIIVEWEGKRHRYVAAERERER
jgi:hypothetical protein